MNGHLLTFRLHLFTELDYIYGREIQLFCYITNSRIVENENASVTRSILVINSYDAIFSNILVLFACQLSFV